MKEAPLSSNQRLSKRGPVNEKSSVHLNIYSVIPVYTETFNYKLNDKPEKMWYSTLRNQEQHSTERNYTMKTISSAIFYMSEWQAIFQCQEYSFSEVRPYQDKQKNMIGLAPC